MRLVDFDPGGTELMTVDEFFDNVRLTAFTDYDGSGYYGSKDFYDRDSPAVPSEIYRGEGWKHGAWTHVHWFNK